MDKRGAFFLILAFALAVTTGGGIHLYLKGAAATQGSVESNTVPVVVASEHLNFGTRLAENHLRVVQFPKESVPTGAYSDVDSVVTQTSKVFMVAGEPILEAKLSGVGGGLSVRIPESMRAISLDVNEVTGVNGFVLPGDRVDVLVTVDNARGPNIAVTKTILQNIEVAAAGAKTAEVGKGRVTVQSVTLIVKPSGAEKLALSAHQGTVHLVLRNPVDHELLEAKSTDTKMVLGLYTTSRKKVRRSTKPKPVPVVVEPAPEESFKFTIIRNGNISLQEAPVAGDPDETDETGKTGKTDETNKTDKTNK
jgi:pilus assembly protein CpaB